ncbi:MAG TPA: hypothetical protein PK570_05350 [Thermoanaerobaculia bacterium]|nr:hypothetical protein [Thermoanaerobaculia bacterium]
MSNFELIGLPNQAALSTATMQAGTEATGFDVENLQGDEPSVRWRSTSNLPRSATFRWTANSTEGIEADRLALVGSNLRGGSAWVRVITVGSAYTADPSVAFARELATLASIEASTNLTGSAGMVDENFTPDNSWIGPTTTGSAWDVRFAWSGFLGALVDGAYRQQFWVYARADGSTAATPCTLEAELWEAGAKVADLGVKPVLSSTGQWLCWGWDAALLAGDGSAAELKLIATPKALKPAPRYVQVDAVAFLYERAEAVNLVAQLRSDSGWLPVPASAASGFGAPGPEDGAGDVTVVVEVPASSGGSVGGVAGVYVLIAEDHAPPDFANDEATPTEPPGYVEAGVLVIGRAWSPARGIPAQGEFLRVVDPSRVQRTPGGQTFGVRLRPYREVTLQLGALTAAEARGLIDRFLLRHGARRPVLVRLLPDDADWAPLGAVWAELVEAAAFGGAAARGRLRGSLTLREKL